MDKSLLAGYILGAASVAIGILAMDVLGGEEWYKRQIIKYWKLLRKVKKVEGGSERGAV